MLYIKNVQKKNRKKSILTEVTEKRVLFKAETLLFLIFTSFSLFCHKGHCDRYYSISTYHFYLMF